MTTTYKLDDCSFMYQRVSDNNEWIPNDGVLISLHGDSGEMLEINPETGESKHVQLTAPLEVIRNRIKTMHKQGFKLVPAINLSCRKYAELGCPCCVFEKEMRNEDLEEQELDDAIMTHMESMCHC